MATLSDKTILVKGASQVPGEQVAKAYAAAGATVILVARHQKNWKKSMTRLSKPDTPNHSLSALTLLARKKKNLNISTPPLPKPRKANPTASSTARIFLRPLAAGFPNRRRMGQPIPHQHRRTYGADPRPVPAAEAVARRVRHLRRRKPRRNTQSLLGRLQRVQSRVELPVQSRRRRMGTLRQPARQRPRPRTHQFPATHQIPSGRSQKRTQKLRGRAARICLLGKYRKQRAERRNRLPLNPEKAGIPPAPRFRLKNIRTFRAHPSRTDKHLDLNLHKDNNDNPLFP